MTCNFYKPALWWIMTRSFSQRVRLCPNSGKVIDWLCYLQPTYFQGSRIGVKMHYWNSIRKVNLSRWLLFTLHNVDRVTIFLQYTIILIVVSCREHLTDHRRPYLYTVPVQVPRKSYRYTSAYLLMALPLRSSRDQQLILITNIPSPLNTGPQ